MDDERTKHAAARHGNLASAARVHVDANWREPSGRMLWSEEPSGPPTVAAVAPGRTVDTGQQRLGPGEEVTLPLSEVERLRTLGFVT
jgi:hypothetical protein